MRSEQHTFQSFIEKHPQRNADISIFGTWEVHTDSVQQKSRSFTKKTHGRIRKNVLGVLEKTLLESRFAKLALSFGGSRTHADALKEQFFVPMYQHLGAG